MDLRSAPRVVEEDDTCAVVWTDTTSEATAHMNDAARRSDR
jgi:hypothetical protein